MWETDVYLRNIWRGYGTRAVIDCGGTFCLPSRCITEHTRVIFCKSNFRTFLKNDIRKGVLHKCTFVCIYIFWHVPMITDAIYPFLPPNNLQKMCSLDASLFYKQLCAKIFGSKQTLQQCETNGWKVFKEIIYIAMLFWLVQNVEAEDCLSNI